MSDRTAPEASAGSVPAYSVQPSSTSATSGWSATSTSAASTLTSTSTSTATLTSADARYVLGPRLGEGGMGRVFSAYDRALDRTVALKEVKDVGPHTEALLRAEAALTATLDHPGIIPIYDVGQREGRLFYTMRLVRGRTLADALRVSSRTSSTAARLSWLRAVASAAGAVHHAHTRGIVHGDLKPENILVGERGDVQVADWGLATRVDQTPRRLGGTPAYQAPEAQRGPCAPHPTLDVFALGVILRAVVDAGAVDVAPALDAIIVKATAIAPGDRYEDAGAFADDVLAFVEARAVAAHNEGLPERVLRLWRRHRVVANVAAMAVVVVVVAASVAFRETARERDRAVRAERDARRAAAITNTELARALLADARAALPEERDGDVAEFIDRVFALADAADADRALLPAERQALLRELRETARGVRAALVPPAGTPTLVPKRSAATAGCGRIFLGNNERRPRRVFGCRVGDALELREVSTNGDEATVLRREPLRAVDVVFADHHAVVSDSAGQLTLLPLGPGPARALGAAVQAAAFLAVAETNNARDNNDNDDNDDNDDNNNALVVSANRGIVLRSGQDEHGIPVCAMTGENHYLLGLYPRDGHIEGVCANGAIVVVDRDRITATPPPTLSPTAIALLHNVNTVSPLEDGTLALGTLRGALLRYRPPSASSAASSSSSSSPSSSPSSSSGATLDMVLSRASVGAITSIVPLDANTAWVSGTQGAPALWPLTAPDAGTPATAVAAPFSRSARGPLLLLPATADAPPRALAAGADGAAFSFVRAPLPVPRVLTLPVGLATVGAVDAATVVVGGAEGLVVDVDLRAGAARAVPAGLLTTVKHVALSGTPPHTRVAIGAIGLRGPLVWRPATAALTVLANTTAKRVGFYGDDSGDDDGNNDGNDDRAPLWLADDYHGVYLLKDPAPQPQPSPPLDVAALSAQRLVTLSAGGVLAVTDIVDNVDAHEHGLHEHGLHEHGLRALPSPVRVEGGAFLAGTADGFAVATDHDVSVFRVDDHGAVAAVRTLAMPALTAAQPARPTAVTFAPDLDQVVVGTLTGDVLVFAGDALVLRAPLHRERVGALAAFVDGDGVRVVSVGWDGVVTSLALPAL